MNHGQSTLQVIREKNQPLNIEGSVDLLDYVRNADEQHNVIIKLFKRPQKQQNHENMSKKKILQSRSGKKLHWKYILLKVNEA